MTKVRRIHAPAKPRVAIRRDCRDFESRTVRRQSRHHPQPRDENAAEETLVDRRLAHLRFGIPWPPAQGDGTAELDRAVLSRRGYRLCGGASALLLLPARGRQPFSRRLGEG